MIELTSTTYCIISILTTFNVFTEILQCSSTWRCEPMNFRGQRFKLLPCLSSWDHQSSRTMQIAVRQWNGSNGWICSQVVTIMAKYSISITEMTRETTKQLPSSYHGEAARKQFRTKFTMQQSGH